VRFFGRGKSRQTFAERVGQLVDADLADVVERRLPPEDRSALAFLLMRDDGQDSNFLIDSFAAGYDWGEQSGVFLVATSDELREPVARAAAAYSTRQQMASAMSWEIDELGRAAAIRRHFRDVLPLVQGRLVTDADAPGSAGGPGAGFTAWLDSKELPTGEAALVDKAAGFFHVGAAFYGFETQLLLALRHLARAERIARG
jgi:hypothetical protein